MGYAGSKLNFQLFAIAPPLWPIHVKFAPRPLGMTLYHCANFTAFDHTVILAAIHLNDRIHKQGFGPNLTLQVHGYRPHRSSCLFVRLLQDIRRLLSLWRLTCKSTLFHRTTEFISDICDDRVINQTSRHNLTSVRFIGLRHIVQQKHEDWME